MILIKKYNFDLLFIKHVNNLNSLRVILYLKEFEVDTTQKTKTIKKINVNTNIIIIEKLKKFYEKFSKVKSYIKY